MLADDELRQVLVTRIPDLWPDVDAELDGLLARARSRSRRRRTTYVAGLVAAVVTTVFVLGHDWSPRADAPEPVDDPLVRALIGRGLYAEPAALEPGRYRAHLIGAVRGALKVELDIPAGWGQDDVYAFSTGPGADDDTRRIDLYANVRRLVPSRCRSQEVEVGPGARSIANALAALGGPTARAPEPVELGGYRGYQVWVDGDGAGRPQGCRGTYQLREGSLDVREVRQVRGWTARTWVLDVGKDLVIVAASHGPDVSPAQEQELFRIVESATFVRP